MKMSGECYSTENLLMDINSSRRDNVNQRSKINDQSNVKMNQLLEYETMVTSAESKCSQLKGQLERIKQFYNNQTESVKSTKIQLSGSKYLKGKFGSFAESTTSKDSQAKIAKLVRQNSRCIGTDTTGAALSTINNILAGITKSMQIPELFDQVKAYDLNKIKISGQNKSEDQIHGVEKIKINSKSKQIVTIKSKSKIKARTSRSRVTSKTSSIILKKTRKSAIKIPDKINRSIENQLSSKPGITKINNKSKRMVGKSRYIPKAYNSKYSSGNHDFVEIYHNTAVKESKSSDSDVPKKRMTEKEKMKTVANVELIAPLNIGNNNEKVEQSKGVVSCIDRNYAMPTISSRMKQVAKYYMNSFNIKSIPFCPATSTSPSHNIGINIQQVMSMVKTKQPVGKLSPTLAYNIALAAGKWEDNPLSILVSSVTSRNMLSQCPLSKSTINYQHLQEIAKTIPQETIEEAEENDDINSPETQSMIITGPSGDVKVTNRKQTVWAANADDKKCTCVPQKGVEVQQIIDKFNRNVSKSKMNKTPSVIRNKFKEPKTAHADVMKECLKPQTEYTPLQNKEKKLKEVLSKLHDEFENMTKKYDELIKKNEDGTANPESNNELDNLDKELNSKEEEIVMVMTLYKEVLALKQQVKALKDRSSKDNICIKTPSTKFNSYNDLTTAGGLLNKLLQRIQHFQTYYKRN